MIGARSIVHCGAVIGADGFGMAEEDGRWLKIPQIGRVVIGADCEIGANTTIDRGAIDDTVIEDDVKLDNQIQIGHNCRIGAHTAIAGCVGIAGSTTIGRNVKIGGAAMIGGHLTIADGTIVIAAATGRRSTSIDEPGRLHRLVSRAAASRVAARRVGDAPPARAGRRGSRRSSARCASSAPHEGEAPMTLAEFEALLQHAAAPLSGAADRPARRMRARRVGARPEVRHRQRAVLPGPLSPAIR